MQVIHPAYSIRIDIDRFLNENCNSIHDLVDGSVLEMSLIH